MSPMPNVQFRIVFTTVPDAALAAAIAQGLVENKLAACVSIMPGLTSIYRWNGQIQKDAEVLMIIKTRAGIITQLTQYIKDKHPAEVPEVIAFPITEGNNAYLEWLGANTIFTRKEEGLLPL